MNGLQMEKVVLRLVEELGFECPKPREIWNTGYLYNQARDLAGEHLELNSRGGVLRRLVPTDDWGVLDRVYKVDVIVRQYTGELWALQLTTDAEAVDKKLGQLCRTDSLRLAVGITKTCLVEIKPPQPTWEGLGLTSRVDRDHLEECLYGLFETIEKSDKLLYYQLDLSWLK
ncbi:MAG: hypothetical protein ACK5SY_00620 [bacterium]|jgi:hypothetical protein|uniref:Uncharacterized protein n=1 Tax=Bacteriophage sp. TaxID=38018 RepID=A0A7G9A3X1_9VIRU|nr:MAG: hypothetical protein [Bacteriophage sp.]